MVELATSGDGTSVFFARAAFNERLTGLRSLRDCRFREVTLYFFWRCCSFFFLGKPLGETLHRSAQADHIAVSFFTRSGSVLAWSYCSVRSDLRLYNSQGPLPPRLFEGQFYCLALNGWVAGSFRTGHVGDLGHNVDRAIGVRFHCER